MANWSLLTFFFLQNFCWRKRSTKDQKGKNTKRDHHKSQVSCSTYLFPLEANLFLHNTEVDWLIGWQIAKACDVRQIEVKDKLRKSNLHVLLSPPVEVYCHQVLGKEKKPSESPNLSSAKGSNFNYAWYCNTYNTRAKKYVALCGWMFLFHWVKFQVRFIVINW